MTSDLQAKLEGRKDRKLSHQISSRLFKEAVAAEGGARRPIRVKLHGSVLHAMLWTGLGLAKLVMVSGHGWLRCCGTLAG